MSCLPMFLCAWHAIVVSQPLAAALSKEDECAANSISDLSTKPIGTKDEYVSMSRNMLQVISSAADIQKHGVEEALAECPVGYSLQARKYCQKAGTQVIGIAPLAEKCSSNSNCPAFDWSDSYGYGYTCEMTSGGSFAALGENLYYNLCTKESCPTGYSFQSGSCQTQATCVSFTSCSAPTPVNKGSNMLCSGAAASCDASTCCEAQATCAAFTSCSASMSVNKGSSVLCSGNAASCDATTCCKSILEDYTKLADGGQCSVDGVTSAEGIGWSPSTCGDQNPCTEGRCPSIEKCLEDCSKDNTCGAAGYYLGHCWLYKIPSERIEKTTKAFTYYECYAKKLR